MRCHFTWQVVHTEGEQRERKHLAGPLPCDLPSITNECLRPQAHLPPPPNWRHWGNSPGMPCIQQAFPNPLCPAEVPQRVQKENPNLSQSRLYTLTTISVRVWRMGMMRVRCYKGHAITSKPAALFPAGLSYLAQEETAAFQRAKPALGLSPPESRMAQGSGGGTWYTAQSETKESTVSPTLTHAAVIISCSTFMWRQMVDRQNCKTLQQLQVWSFQCVVILVRQHLKKKSPVVCT